MIPIGQWLEAQATLPVWDASEPETQISVSNSSNDHTERIAEAAFERGRLEAELELKAQLQLASTEARKRCEELLSEVRNRWLQEHVQPLSAKFGAAVVDMEARLSETLVKVLKPFITKAVMQRARDEFQAAVASYLGDTETCPMRLRGPKDLLDTLGQQLKHNGIAVTLEEASSTEVMLDAGGTAFESQAAKWLAAIESVNDG